MCEGVLHHHDVCGCHDGIVRGACESVLHCNSVVSNIVVCVFGCVWYVCESVATSPWCVAGDITAMVYVHTGLRVGPSRNLYV